MAGALPKLGPDTLITADLWPLLGVIGSASLLINTCLAYVLPFQWIMKLIYFWLIFLDDFQSGNGVPFVAKQFNNGLVVRYSAGFEHSLQFIGIWYCWEFRDSFLSKTLTQKMSGSASFTFFSCLSPKYFCFEGFLLSGSLSPLTLPLSLRILTHPHLVLPIILSIKPFWGPSSPEWGSVNLLSWCKTAHQHLCANLYLNVYSGFIHNSKKLETSQMSFSGWIVKQTAVHPHHRAPLGNKKGQTIDISNNLDESQGITMCEKSHSQRLYTWWF